MKKIIFIILFASLFTECNKSKDDFSASLIGEWSWIKSCGGIGGICYTPSTTKQNDRIVFADNSLYYLYRNDTLKLTRNYTTYQETTKFNSTIVDIIEFDQSGIQYSFSLRHDTLLLNDYNMSDGFASYYKRIK